ncbi:hypothetical protein PVAP13_5NG252781 [Panicum virgatum]|uniref:Uncharacterized protein n=1 Tax=Panicum virgatum TaxID=38727 RepID=A0A8T0RW94_PANVG|nr:hypothetical protein PVAP13_5NG252781 [Panicum virgatum]
MAHVAHTSARPHAPPCAVPLRQPSSRAVAEPIGRARRRRSVSPLRPRGGRREEGTAAMACLHARPYHRDTIARRLLEQSEGAGAAAGRPRCPPSPPCAGCSSPAPCSSSCRHHQPANPSPLRLPGPNGRGALVDAVAGQQDDDHDMTMAMDVDRSHDQSNR